MVRGGGAGAQEGGTAGCCASGSCSSSRAAVAACSWPEQHHIKVTWHFRGFELEKWPQIREGRSHHSDDHEPFIMQIPCGHSLPTGACPGLAHTFP